MAQQIITSGLVASNFPVNIEGISLFLRISWNSRTESWSLDAYDSERVAIETGIKISSQQPLIVFGLDKWPLNGNLFVAPTSLEEGKTLLEQEITFENFGGTRNYQLYYVPRSEYLDFQSAIGLYIDG